mgnify:CR=1 FL=1
MHSGRGSGRQGGGHIGCAIPRRGRSCVPVRVTSPPCSTGMRPVREVPKCCFFSSPKVKTRLPLLARGPVVIAWGPVPCHIGTQFCFSLGSLEYSSPQEKGKEETRTLSKESPREEIERENQEADRQRQSQTRKNKTEKEERKKEAQENYCAKREASSSEMSSSTRLSRNSSSAASN